MSKPILAEEFGIPMDLSHSSVENALIRINERMEGDSVRIYYYVKVSMPLLFYAANQLKEFGISVLLDGSYDMDEWSMVGVLATAKSGYSELKKFEVWSPGA